MKKFLILLFFLGSFMFLAKEALAAIPINRSCLGMQVKFTAKNFKGTIDIACAGNLNAQGCAGKVLKNIKPNANKRYVLPNCTCPNFSDGCLKIGQNLKLVNHYNSKLKSTLRVVEGNINRVPPGCRLIRYGRQCGKNGNVIKPGFRIACGIAPTPTPTPRPSPSPSPSPSICPTPVPVLNVKIKCPNCLQTNPITIDKTE